jgi:uncharacterized protein
MKNITKLIFSVLLTVLFINNKVFSQTVDCVSAVNFAETAICTNQELRDIDAQYFIEYGDYAAQFLNDERFFDEEMVWREKRNQCNSLECIKNIYNERKTDLPKLKFKSDSVIHEEKNNILLERG